MHSKHAPTPTRNTARITSGTVIERRRLVGVVAGLVRDPLVAVERQEEGAERVERRQERREHADPVQRHDTA